jgi:hypothetical protein
MTLISSLILSMIITPPPRRRLGGFVRKRTPEARFGFAPPIRPAGTDVSVTGCVLIQLDDSLCDSHQIAAGIVADRSQSSFIRRYPQIAP